jgi:aspartyl-tRNA synthetase
MKGFEITGRKPEWIKKNFGHMLEAFEYGVPPHGGMAPGLERWLMVLLGEDAVREVVPFPKNQQAIDVMMDAPSEVDDKQLKELHIKVAKSKK